MKPLFRIALAAGALALCACPASHSGKLPEGAKLLYETSFSAPEQTADTGVKIVEPTSEYPFPTKLPSGVFFGKPMVVATLCGMDQPVRLSAATGDNGMEGLEFLFDPRYRTYHIELDLCVVDIGPPPVQAQPVQVGLYFDIASAHVLGFTANAEVAILDPNREPDVRDIPAVISHYKIGKPMRVTVDLDLPIDKQTWRISLDGKVLKEAQILATIPRAMRVVVRGNPKTVAALDNLRIWAEHEMKDPEPPPAQQP